LSWPHNEATWPGIFERIPDQYARLVQLVAQFEPVKLLVGSETARQEAQRRLTGTANVELIEIPTNDSWIRDFGPVFLAWDVCHHQPTDTSAPIAIDWGYNSWGGKYPPFDRDAAAGAAIAARAGYRCVAPGVILEPGAIDGNGQGTIITSTSCVLSSSRNPKLTRGDVERLLNRYLGAQHVIWLAGESIAGDDTDGHVDQVARFVGPSQVVAAYPHEVADDHDSALVADYQTLCGSQNQAGQKLSVTRLINPPPLHHEGHRLPASYCNFYFANGGVLVPTFNSPRSDAAALETLSELFPNRRVVGFDCRELVWGLGAIHCLTQQQPVASGES
jgi:agmatine deiminase